MNENINLFEILKDTPKGTLLYSPLTGEVEFNKLDSSNKFPINVLDKRGDRHYFTQQGTYFLSMGECLLFPSKDQRDWNKYKRPFVNGDVITSKGGGIALFSHTQARFECSNVVYYHCVFFPPQTFKLGLDYGIGYVSDCRLATEEEKQKLFKAIKDNGYKWNNQAKKLEMLITPNFKVGDIIQNKDAYKVKITAIDEDGFYEYESLMAKGIGTITFKDQYDWELVEYKVGDHFVNSTNSNLFIITEIRCYGDYKIQDLYGSSHIVNKHYLDEYFKINKWDPKWFKPFDKVLVRNHKDTPWTATLFSHICNSKEYPYKTSYTNTKYCIPYNIETKHLVGTTLEELEFYKNWQL
jgi:hypothetical protein